MCRAEEPRTLAISRPDRNGVIGSWELEATRMTLLSVDCKVCKPRKIRRSSMIQERGFYTNVPRALCLLSTSRKIAARMTLTVNRSTGASDRGQNCGWKVGQSQEMGALMDPNRPGIPHVVPSYSPSRQIWSSHPLICLVARLLLLLL